MQTPDSNPFADKKAIIGVVVIAIFMMGWQYFMAKKYPPATKAIPVVANQTAPATGAEPTSGTPSETAPVKSSDAVVLPETLYTYEDDRIRFTVTSRGLGLKEYVLKDYKDTQGEPIRLGFSPQGSLFELRLADSATPVNFQLKEIGPGDYEGEARTEVGLIRRRLKYDSEKRAFESFLSVKDAKADLGRGLTLLVPETIRAKGSSSWLFPSYEHQDFFVGHSGTKESVNINHAKENFQKDFKTVSFVSLGDQYFTAAIMDESDISPDLNVQADIHAKTALAKLSYHPANATDISLKQIFYAGPKSIDILKKIDPAMASLIDLGFLAFIAKPLLYTMKWFHSVVGNWGLAIILLTILVRFLVLPFALTSARSMKAMQRIQPQLNALRERLKDDPMRLNQEMMAVMRENKANPIGGCLPMLLQIPIFFALYRVISSSVELYQSPFVLWIHDLSLHDPFYVLPVLMGITMFAQQKMTPMAGMDPTQAKIMQFLPLIFCLFMLQLPAGLTLYMVVSAVFGIVQQWFIMRETRPAAVPAKK